MLDLTLPFLIRAHVEPGNGGFPQLLPFRAQFDTGYGMFCQRGTPELRAIIEQIYRDGADLLGPMNDSMGKAQADAALDFVSSAVGELANKRVLELGAGNGYFLRRLQDAGATVLGVEPARESAADATVQIIRDFFPTAQPIGRFDAIVHFAVLEHIEEFAPFLRSQLDYLNPGGKVVLGVPNCEPQLASGDPSMLTHQHFNYFDRTSLRRTAEACGFEVETIEIGAAGGMIFASLVPAASRLANLPAAIESDYTQRMNTALERLEAALARYEEATTAVYCPGRAANALSLLQRTGTRLADDNPDLQGRYLPVLKQQIESFSELEQSPPQAIFIFSRTFGARIKARCMESPALQQATTTILIEEID